MTQLTQIANSIYATEDFSSQEKALVELVEKVMLHRPICRPRSGKFLEGIYLDILQQCKHQLKLYIEQKIDNCNLQITSLKDLLISLQDKTFKKILTQDVLEKLAIEAKSIPDKNQSQKQYAITELINAMYVSEVFQIKGNNSTDLYKDAVNRTLLYIYQNLDSYNPKRGRFIPWVNYHFSIELKKVRKEQKDPFIQSRDAQIIRWKYQLTSLAKKTNDLQSFFFIYLKTKKFIPSNRVTSKITDLLIILWWLGQLLQKNENLAQPILFKMAKVSSNSSIFYEIKDRKKAIDHIAIKEDNPYLSKEIREYIISDPDGLCQRHIYNYPCITFQTIVLDYLDGKSWKEISESLNLGIFVIKNFFKRALKEIAPSIRQYIQQ